MFFRKFLWIFVFIEIYFLTHASCEDGISLAFAIDDTRSMWDDIAQVTREAKAILKMVLTTKSSEVKDFVLVTINDPDVILRTQTKSPGEFLGYLNRIRIHNYGNYDCAERALAGIEKALTFSKPESYIYVFTDATTKELHKLNSIKRLCQKKQSQVVFVLTGDCGAPTHRMFTVYYEIARACSGQVFRVRKNQVHTVLKTIEILLKGKNSIFNWKTIPKTSTYVPVSFTLDEKAEYAIVSTSGTNVNLKVTTIYNLWGPVPALERTMWNENGKVVKLINPRPGTYFAWVKGQSTISVVIYARTDFTFGYGFSVLEPKSMRDTAKQPIAGLKQHVSINVTDPDNSIRIKSLHILDIKNNDIVIKEMPLRNIGDNIYITEAFVSPNNTFKIAVKGEIIKTNETITRNSRNIDPQIVDLIPESKPEATIIEGTQSLVNYGSAVTLTCEVTAHPAPTIEWYTSSGLVLPSNSSVLEDPLFVSYLKLNNIKQNETYVCKTWNTRGAGRDRRVEVGVRAVFTGGTTTDSQVYNVEYGKDVQIPCNIKSYLPFTVRWYRGGAQLAASPGALLTLSSVDVGMQDKYTCEATLNSDPTVKQTHDIDVKITGLARPKIQPSTGNVMVVKGGGVVLHCNVVQGTPRPQVKWFKKNGDKYTLLSNENNEVLTVNKATFTHAGQYKCEATSPVGSDMATFDVIVRSSPEVSVSRSTTEVPYDSSAELTCRAESYPPPGIVWKDEKGSVLPSQLTNISDYESTSVLKLKNLRRNGVYICLANNNVGSANDYVNIMVTPPFEVKTHMKELIEINYGSEETLHCDIKSAKPMVIRWYKENSVVTSRRSVVTPSAEYRASAGGARLTIASMDMDTAGTYICEASLLSIPTEKISYSITASVVGLVVPEVIYSTTVVNDRNFTAICRIKGVPRPTISWRFKPQGSDEFSLISGSGEEMNIPELKLNHTGVYRCVAQNDIGSTQRDFSVLVKERPIIMNEESEYYGVEGDVVLKVPCDVTGFPEPTVVWKREGKPLHMNSKYMFKGSTLYINNPVKNDSGELTCEANNKLGNATRKVAIDVVDYFQDDENFNGDSTNVDVLQGVSNTIQCNLKHLGEGSVRWYMDGRLTNQTGSKYTISSRDSMSDQGNYTCRVNTGEGSTSQTYVVHFGFSPVFEDSMESVALTIDWRDENQMLDCSADSQPLPDYKWIYNGKEVDTAIDTRQIPITDWGQYACEVSNAHGNISRTFHVTTSGCYITMSVINQNQPLVSDKNTPTWPLSVGNTNILLKENEEIKLSCPNNANSTNSFKVIPGKQEVIAKCKSKDQFVVDGNVYQYSDLQCNAKVEPSVLATGENCSGPHSELIRLGFEVNGFLEIYKVCFDRNLNIPVYASVSINIPRIGDGVNSTKFEWSVAPEIGDRETGLETDSWKPEGSCKCCYTRGQLVNVNELAFGPAQAATFKYNLNSVPVWNPCEGSDRMSWTEFDAEANAMSLHNGWSAWTGASDWSPAGGGLVPKYLWKVVECDGEVLVSVYVNRAAPAPGDVRCTAPCAALLEADRFLYCCTLQEFTDKFGLPEHAF